MRLYTRRYGTGSRQIALLHGVSGDHEMFADLIELLVGRDLTVIGVDLRGHGLSPRAADYDLDSFAADVVETLPTGLDAVLGHSLGARVLLIAVTRLRPRRAIYLDPFWRLPASFDPTAMHANVGEHPDGTPYSLAELAQLNPGWGDENLQRAQRSHARWDPGMLTEIGRGVGEPAPPISRPPVPSLILFGERSPLFAAAPVDELRGAGYDVRVQPGAGHNVHLDDAAATVTAMADWIAP